MKKIIFASVALLAISTSANATIYRYTQSNGDILTINTATKMGSIKGTSIDASFSSDDFATFTGGATPKGSFRLDAIQGYRSVNGQRLTANAAHQQELIFFGNQTNGVNLWSYWGDGSSRRGDYITSISSVAIVPEGSTSTGGSTGGTTSTGGSTGGAAGGQDIPAPSIFLLFALAAGAITYRFRHKA